MLLHPATEADYESIVALVNLAYRGQGTTASWNIETGILEGERMNETLLREEIAAKPDSHLLTCRDEPGGPLLGTAWLNPAHSDAWHLGLLTVRPDLQNRQLGRALLTAAEDFVRQRGGHRMEMSVLHVRDTLIAWYERRGYVRNGKTEPFPYDDQRFGRPLRDDLYFVVLKKEL